jgi:uroporphyrinogen decarboxylase
MRLIRAPPPQPYKKNWPTPCAEKRPSFGKTCQLMPPKNDRLIKALLRQPVDRTPVWMMRQAGRYLPEYLATRASVNGFMGLCQNPELACEVTMQPLRRFDLDAAILFSDILTVPDAMGLGLYFSTGEGPKFERPLRSAADIAKLRVPDPHKDLGYVMQAVSTIRKALNNEIPLIGFAGSPWTLATYMIEGGSSKTFSRIKALRYTDPRSLQLLLDTLADAVAAYLNAQIEAGAQALMIFDTWGGILAHQDYLDFSLAAGQRIREKLHRTHDGQIVPVMWFTKNGGQWLEQQAAAGFDCLGLDWTVNMAQARARVGDKVALQGNLDPSCLLGPPEMIRQQVGRILQEFGPGNGHVFNLGHGITPDVDPDHAGAMIQAVHDLSPAYHR